MEDWSESAAQPYLWLTTVGRRTGLERTVELWFGLAGRTVYLLAGGGERAGWVGNALAHPGVQVRLGGRTFRGVARAPDAQSAEAARARRLLAAKYQGWRAGRPLSRWAAESFCLAVDLTARAA
ncbi:hypothetical protein BH18CHL1_BH18CHL1_00560 [soil metagenome]